jgi:hypothetical protein
MVSRYKKHVSAINKVRIGVIGSVSALEPERTQKILCIYTLLELPHINIDTNVNMIIYKSKPGNTKCCTVASETTELIESEIATLVNENNNTNKININSKKPIFGKIAGLSEQPTVKIISMTIGNDIENKFLSQIKKCHIIIIIASDSDINNMMRSCKHTFLDIDYIIRHIVNGCNCYDYRAKLFIVTTTNNVSTNLINLSECNILNNAAMCNIANIKSKIVETITAHIQLILTKNINLKREKLHQNTLQRPFIPIITAAYLDYMSLILDCDAYLNTNINLDLDEHPKYNEETCIGTCICCCSVVIVLIILAVAMFIIFQI